MHSLPMCTYASFSQTVNGFCCCFHRSNFLRLCVLRVTQQSEKHLQKITSVDEFLRRIYSVIHSNDPIARALTLRYGGSVILVNLLTHIIRLCTHVKWTMLRYLYLSENDIWWVIGYSGHFSWLRTCIFSSLLAIWRQIHFHTDGD